MFKRNIVKILKYTVLLLSINLNSNIYNTPNKHAISYDFSTGRFGDNIQAYVHARYLSYHTQTPFLVRDFPFSNQLNLSYDSHKYNGQKNNYKHEYRIHSPQTLSRFFTLIRDQSTPPTLFILNYFPSDISLWSDRPTSKTILFNLSKQENDFFEYLQKTIQPLISIPILTKPNILNVAAHVRTLSGPDNTSCLINFPLKIPTTTYHKKQIKQLHEWNLNRPMYVFLFSDTKQPHELLSEFEAEFKNTNIEFAIQNLVKPDLNNTVQDFFAMQKFDVLIATQSSFSISATRLTNFDMTIFPIHCKGEYPNYYIDQVRMISKKSIWFPYDLDIILRN